MNFECFCRLSPNHTYLTYRNFLCQYSVIAETTVKQRAFAFIIDRLRVPTLGYPALFTPALFLAQWTHRHKPTCAGFRQTVVPLAEKLARYRLDCFPSPFVSMQTECSKGVGGETSVSRFIKNANFWRFCGSIRACMIRFTLSWSPAKSIRVVIDVSGTIYLRLKPHLVKISSDIVTEYSCQVCILSMMFGRSDRRLCWLG